MEFSLSLGGKSFQRPSMKCCKFQLVWSGHKPSDLLDEKINDGFPIMVQNSVCGPAKSAAILSAKGIIILGLPTSPIQCLLAPGKARIYGMTNCSVLLPLPLNLTFK